ncbi:MAG TPA: LuxR C-terminal-related transcriptional regulator [Vicinamibacterales bacterium]|nr:LuxR C-terminal-related transcriptional regulator [Vicinamibacterales bacterium]
MIESDSPSVIVAAPTALRSRVREALEAAGIAVVFADDEEEIPGEHMTSRERQVLDLLGEGLSNHAIAERLGISDHTVKFHVAAVYGKLGATTRAEAVRRAFRRGLLTL